MSWLSKALKKGAKWTITLAASGPAAAVAHIAVDETKVLDGALDLARGILKIGEDIYRAIPSEVLAIAGDPIHGILKHEFEDELVFISKLTAEGFITGAVLGPNIAVAGSAAPLWLTLGTFIGAIQTRQMNDVEWGMARKVFWDSLVDRNKIILTNVDAVLNGREFTYPLQPDGPVWVNLGENYDHHATVKDLPLLMHELTHVWQSKLRLLKELLVYDAIVDREYGFTPGLQWNEYGLEQQASIVEAWVLGATMRHSGRFDAGARRPFTTRPPLFRYINGNIRRSDNDAVTRSGRSVRHLLAEGGHKSVRAIY